MTEKPRSEPRKFVFELTLGIDSSLSHSGGELATLILDGIFALDDRGLLLPGLTEPVDRLQLASCGATGFQLASREQIAVGQSMERTSSSLPRGGGFQTRSWSSSSG